MIDPEGCKRSVERIPGDLSNDLTKKMHKFKLEYDLKSSEEEASGKALEGFCRENNLNRPAEYNVNKLVLWMVGAIVLEVVLNAFLLVDISGFLPAVAQASLIAIINVAILAWLTSTFWRYKNHVNKSNRFISSLAVPVCIFSICI